MTKKSVNKNVSDRFVNALLLWNKMQNQRQMPWKGEKDPYKIWLSEIILQQTRVEQGLKYYEHFIAAFPTIQHLANAPEQQVFKLWEGLGYYSRCKNLIASAKSIVKEKNGLFPSDYESILALKGVGHYTAAAIASFAYNQPYAVLDGNVYRVLSRIFDIEIPIDSTGGKKLFAALAQELLPKDKAGEYNQAIMDFGATICKPAPECAQCFFQKHCSAFLQGKQQLLPVKEKKTLVKKRWFTYLVLTKDDKVAIRQRATKDIWQNMFEFLLFETEKKTSSKNILMQFQKSFGLRETAYKVLETSQPFEQRLSHQHLYFHFIKAEVYQPAVQNMFWVSPEELKQYPFPRSLQQYIQKHL